MNNLKLVPLVYAFPLLYLPSVIWERTFLGIWAAILTVTPAVVYLCFLINVKGRSDYQSDSVNEIVDTDWVKWPRFILSFLAFLLSPILAFWAGRNPEGLVASLLGALGILEFANLTQNMTNSVMGYLTILIIGCVSMRIVWSFDHRLWMAIDQFMRSDD